MTRAPISIAIRTNEPDARYDQFNEDAYRREVERVIQTLVSEIQKLNARLQGRELVMSDLPIADPLVAGQLWNDGGTVRVSAG